MAAAPLEQGPWPSRSVAEQGPWPSRLRGRARRTRRGQVGQLSALALPQVTQELLKNDTLGKT